MGIQTGLFAACQTDFVPKPKWKKERPGAIESSRIANGESRRGGPMTQIEEYLSHG